ncbi:hypothetical protein D9M71_411360 [compost metagenome]
MITQQPPLPGCRRRQNLGVESPMQVRRKLLRHHASAIVHLQQVTAAVGGEVAAAGMPEFAAQHQHIAGPAQYRLRGPALPMALALGRRPAGAVAAGYDQGRAEVGVDVVEVDLCRADLHRHDEARIGQQALRQLHGQVIQVRFQADEPWVAAPGGLADDMAITAKGGFGQLDDPGQVQVRQPQRVAIEHAFVVVEQAAVVPVLGLEPVDGAAQGRHPSAVEYTGQQHEAVSVQHLQTLRCRAG